MKVRCSYCNSWINDTDEKCPNCGGTNKEYKRTTDKTPKTIGELQQWYEAHHLPPQEKTRFFVGVNYTKPRAFGIYRNEKGEFVVYKNKNNGERAIRYQGTDEAYAVNELYQKLKEEILNQKRHNQLQRNRGSHTRVKKHQSVRNASGLLYHTIYILIVAMLVITCLMARAKSGASLLNRHEGYYRVDDKILYYYDNTWYEYEDWGFRDSSYDETGADSSDDDYGRWVEAEEDYNQYTDIWDYNLGKNYDRTYEWDSNIQQFTDSYVYEQAYEEHKASQSDSDSSYDYDYDYDSSYDWDSGDSWDSGYSDWGSDW